MNLPATIFLGVILLIFLILNITMIVSLIRPGDERNQMIVWKAGAYTLLVATGVLLLDVIENIVRGQEMSLNPLIHLELISIIYFIALIVIKKRHGG